MRMYHLVEAESLWALSQRGAVNLPQVKELQDKLRAAGFDPGPSDGWYGQKTADAVRQYQQANNLPVDGDAGPQTLSRLGMSISQAATNIQQTPNIDTTQQTQTRNTSQAGNTTQVDRVARAADQGGQELAQLIIAGLLGYGLYRAARQAGQNPPPLGSNPTPVIPGTPAPTPVTTPTRGLVQGSSNRDAANAVRAVSQNEFELTYWQSNSSSQRSFMDVELNPRGQLATGYRQLTDDYRARNEYEAMVARYVRRQIQLIPGNISSLSVGIYSDGRLLESFATYLG
jgi:peptidoglycan hydrolase-like protein with peptidoglycan-binding domain